LLNKRFSDKFHRFASESDAVVWRERKSRDTNPVMTFTIKKRINTELFIDRKRGLYLQNGDKETDQGNGEGGQSSVMVLVDLLCHTRPKLQNVTKAKLWIHPLDQNPFKTILMFKKRYFLPPFIYLYNCKSFWACLQNKEWA